MRRSSLVSLTFLFLVSSWRAHPLFPRITRRNAYDSRHTREMQQRIRHDAMRRRQRMQPELQCHFGECVCSLMLRCTHGDFNRREWQERAERAARHAYLVESRQKDIVWLKSILEKKKSWRWSVLIYLYYCNWQDMLSRNCVVKMGRNGEWKEVKWTSD